MNATNKTGRAACPQAAAAVERAASPFRPRTRWQRVLPAAALAAAVLALPLASFADGATLTHRWSFNGAPGNANLVTNLYDSVGGLHATLYANGNKVAFTDGKARCSGFGSGDSSFNLGTDILGTGSATIEIWATWDVSSSWARLFDYGSDQNNFLYMSWNRGKNAGSDCDRVELKSGGSTIAYVNESMAPYCMGKPYHFAMTIAANGDGSSTIRWMRRDAATGALEKSRSMDVSDWTLASFSGAKFYLGKSQYTDYDGDVSYDEVRIYRGVVGDEQLAANAVAGPDALVPAVAETSATGFNVPAG